MKLLIIFFCVKGYLPRFCFDFLLFRILRRESCSWLCFQRFSGLSMCVSWFMHMVFCNVSYGILNCSYGLFIWLSKVQNGYSSFQNGCFFVLLCLLQWLYVLQCLCVYVYCCDAMYYYYCYCVLSWIVCCLSCLYALLCECAYVCVVWW